MSTADTIAAIATAPGRAAIGVVRLSGPRLRPVMEQIVGRALAPRRAVLSTFKDANGDAIDEGIALYFPAPQSYTGEDVLELQGHGGPVVLQILLQRCVELGARIAEPGEFTRRAFLNGRLDLAQAESVVDLIDAATTAAARGAMRSLRGEFSSQIQALSSKIVELRALIEATLDFPEEEIDFLRRSAAQERLDQLIERLGAVLATARQGSLLREGMHIVLAGQPNVGKSSLLNRFAGEELAIVTDTPGTTRDAIRQVVDLGGVPAQFVDTAGLRDSIDPVERIGIDRAWNAIEHADAVVLVADATAGVTNIDDDILRRLPRNLPRVRAMNKIDLLPRKAQVEHCGDETVVWLSAKTGEGMDLLQQTLLNLVAWQGQGEGVFLARARHVDALRRASEHLARASSCAGRLELFAEELRLAHDELGAITGEFTPDDLLGEIFSRFCIGK